MDIGLLQYFDPTAVDPKTQKKWPPYVSPTQSFVITLETNEPGKTWRMGPARVWTEHSVAYKQLLRSFFRYREQQTHAGSHAEWMRDCTLTFVTSVESVREKFDALTASYNLEYPEHKIRFTFAPVESRVP